MVDIKYFGEAVMLMDEEIREEICESGEFYGDEEGFLREYERRHFEKYGIDFVV